MSSFGVRKLKPNRKEPSTSNDCLFSVSRGPLTPQKRDVSLFEDYRQRAFIESMKDAFRTISFRSEPTIGEESLTRRSNTQRAKEVHGQVPGKNSYPVMHKKCEELVQNLVPDCYEHIQNFHHYRSDMARLNSGFKVLYLSGSEKAGAKNETADLRRVYGQNSKGPEENASINGIYQMFPGRMFRSTRLTNTVSKKAFTLSQKSREETKNSKTNSKKKSTCSEARLKGKDAQRSTNEGSTGRSFNKEQQLLCEDDQGHFNAKNDNELPCFKLEHAAVNSMENQASFDSLVSDISPKPPMATPDDMSRRSSIRTLVFESEDFTNRERNRASSPRNSIHEDSSQGRHYLAPFNSRFPHLKASSDSRSSRQKRCGDKAIPPWQQYRILCDAFRRNISAERGFYQKNDYNGYKRPKFATATELEYYIDVVSETNNNSTLHMS